MVTSERLKAIKERCERATPGPWIVSPNRHKAKDGSQWGIIEARIRTVTGGIVAHTICTWDGDNGRANAEFAAHAREDVPALVAEVERLHRFVDRAREQIKAWRTRAEEESRTASKARDVFAELSYGASSRAWYKAEEELQALLNELEEEDYDTRH